MDILFSIIVVIVSSILVYLMIELYRHTLDFGRIEARRKLHRVVIDGFFSYRMARLHKMIPHDPDIPENFEEMRVVKDYNEEGNHLSGNHIVNQELYNKLENYSKTFGHVNFLEKSAKSFSDALSGVQEQKVVN